MARRARWRRMGCLVFCLATFAACGFPRPPDVPDCTSSEDCKSPGVPFCQTSSGTCVGCLDGTGCPTDKPVCDASSHVCRSCDRDDECPSGVCVDAEGRCALTNEVIFLRELSTDNAMCSATMPCATFAAALAMLSPQRYIIHIIGGTFHMDVGVELSGKRVYVDGSDTNIICNQGTPFSSTKNGPSITLGRMTINGVGGGTGVVASNNGAIHGRRSRYSALDRGGGSMLGWRDAERRALERLERRIHQLHVDDVLGSVRRRRAPAGRDRGQGERGEQHVRQRLRVHRSGESHGDRVGQSVCVQHDGE